MQRDTMMYWGDTYAANWRPRALVQPAAEDIAHLEAMLHAPQRGGRGLAALLLGVTRPIAAMRWPANTDLLALDWSEPVIRRLWRTEGLPAGAAVVRGDWREMPIAAASRDAAFSDGCYHSISSNEDGLLLTRELHRVLRPGGSFYTRNFLAQDPPERIDDLFGELFAGSAGSLHVFRWRLAAAMQGRSGQGVRRHDIWEMWHRHVGNAAALKSSYDPGDDGFVIFERFQGLGGRLFYYTLRELERMVAPWFDLVEMSVPSYPGGERFPRLVLRSRA